MLIIQRARNRSFYLIDADKKIKITYKGSSGAMGRIGIEAPKSVKIIKDDNIDFDEDGFEENDAHGNF
jgi:sRNA-binding carbon storage regulator CsrA